MPRRHPLTAIFNPEARRGSVNPGAMIGTRAPIVRTIGGASETDSAGAITRSKRKTIGAGVETDTAGVITRNLTLSIVGTVTDTLLDGARNLVVDGSYAYVISAAQDRMTVVDISNPAAPSVVGSYQSSTNIDNCQRIAKSGNYVFVTSNTGDSVASIDVSTPSSPTFGSKVTNATTLDGAYGIAISGTNAFISCEGTAGRRLTTVDISNPLSMSVTGSTGSADLTNFGQARGVVIGGNYAYVCSLFNNKITVVDISTPASPSVVASVSDATKLGSVAFVVKDGDYLYAQALTIVDVTTPTSPTLKDHESFGGNGLCKIGNYVFASNGGAEVHVADVSDVNNIIDTGDSVNDALLSGVNDLVTDGTYIYAACALADRLAVLRYT